MSNPDMEITIVLKGHEEARQLAFAISLLRFLGETYGNEDAIHVADQATDALQELTTEVERNDY